MPIIYKSRRPTRINHTMPKGSQGKKSVKAPHTGGVPSPIEELVLNKKWRDEIKSIARAAATAAKVVDATTAAAAVNVAVIVAANVVDATTAATAAAAAVAVNVAATATAPMGVAVACGGGSATVAAVAAAGKAAAVAVAASKAAAVAVAVDASKAADRKAMVAAADMAIACGSMAGWSVSGGGRYGFDMREVLMMGRCVSSSLPWWVSLAIDNIMEAAKELNICLATTGIVVDASNQMAMTKSLMIMREFTSMFEQAVIVAAQTTYATGLGAAFDHFKHLVPDGCVELGEKQGKYEDEAVAAFIGELTRAYKSALVLSGDGKIVPGDDDIFRAVEAHLQAGLPLIILAKDGTCSGHYDALQVMYPELLRVIRCVIPE